MPQGHLRSALLILEAIEVKDLQKPLQDFLAADKNVQQIVNRDIIPYLDLLPPEELDQFRSDVQKLANQLISSYRSFQETKRVIDLLSRQVKPLPGKEPKEGIPPDEGTEV